MIPLEKIHTRAKDKQLGATKFEEKRTTSHRRYT